MSDYFQQTNTSNQTTNDDENQKDEVITFNYQRNGMGQTSDIIENKIVVLDYTTRNITTNLNSFDNLNPAIIVLQKLNISYEDFVKSIKEKLITKIVDGKYVMNDKDVIYLDKMIGLACIAMSESEKNNKQLRTRNRILQNKCENYDCVVNECNRLKSEMDEIKFNLCLALGRRFNDKEDVMHLTNFCAALAARENEYHHVIIENDKFKNIINKQLMNIRVKTLDNYDEILQSVDKLKEELYIKDLKISQLKDELCLINEKKNIRLQCNKHENLSEFCEKLIDQNVHDAFDYSQNNNELYEGKMLIAKQINQIQGSTNFESENHQLCDLINMLGRLTTDEEERLKTINRRLIRNVEEKNDQLQKEIEDHKKWQKYLENENNILNSEFENKKQIQQNLIVKENELKKLKEDYSEMQLMCDGVNKKNAHLIESLDEYQQLSTERKMKCVDGDNLIKTLQFNLKEQTNKFERLKAKYNIEKEKYQENETYTLQMMDELTSCLHQKEIDIALLQTECNDLKQHIKSEKDYTDILKHEMNTLVYALKEKNKTIAEISKAQSKKQYTATLRSSSLISNNQLHMKSQLEQKIDILLDNISTWNNIIVGYEKMLCDMQNAIQQQSTKRNYYLAKYQHLKDIEYKATLTENLIKEKEVIELQHHKEIGDIKEKYNSTIAHMADSEVNLRNEIRDLKESLKLKSLHLMMAEKIASLQLKESLATVQRLTNISYVQSLKLNDIQNGISKRCCDKNLFKTTNNRFQKMEGLFDHMLKLTSENKCMKKVCENLKEKIMSLENNCHCKCTRTPIRKY